MLKGKHGRGREYSHLFAIAKGLERSAHRDFSFAESDVAAQQAIHRLIRFHIAFDLRSGLNLIFGGRVFKRIFKLALPVGIGRKREAFGEAPLGVELQQLFSHVAHSGFDARLGFVPRNAAQAINWRLGFACTAILLDKIHACERHIEPRLARIFEQHEVALLIALRNLAQSQKPPHAMLRMHHEVARLEIGNVCRKGRDVALNGRLANDKV